MRNLILRSSGTSGDRRRPRAGDRWRADWPRNRQGRRPRNTRASRTLAVQLDLTDEETAISLSVALRHSSPLQ
jgi:hypothetical protein